MTPLPRTAEVIDQVARGLNYAHLRGMLHRDVKLLTEAPPIPREVNPALPEAVQDVILKAMAHSPDDHYASAVELSAAFRQSLPI